jgi:hypothetical protein
MQASADNFLGFGGDFLQSFPLNRWPWKDT